MTPVTFVPITALIVVELLPKPEFVIVPALLIDVVERVIALKEDPELITLVMILPVPVIPPVNISLRLLVPVIVRLLFSVTAPLKVVSPLAIVVILSVPLLPEAIVIGLAKVRADALFRVASALPEVSPRVIVPVPAALADV